MQNEFMLLLTLCVCVPVDVVMKKNLRLQKEFWNFRAELAIHRFV